MQRLCPMLKQRCNNFISMLFQRGLNVCKNYIEKCCASNKYEGGGVNLPTHPLPPLYLKKNLSNFNIT